ncbi:MAG: hypothetical protein IKO39_03285, partial [Treponema sp.]|nr:hypothetical protein [Treponema sp.]
SSVPPSYAATFLRSFHSLRNGLRRPSYRLSVGKRWRSSLSLTCYPPSSSKLPPSNTHSVAAFLPSSSALLGTVQDYSHNKASHPQTARW